MGLFREAKEAARHHAGYSVVDAVVAVPPFFTQWERAAILQAASMAGLEVASLVNEGTAVAIDYFVSRTIETEPKLVILYDVGQVSTKATLVRFERVPHPKHPDDPKKATPTATVLDVAWDDSLGGRNFDENLQQHLLKVATKESGLEVASNERSVEKLRAEAQRVKEILSANTEIDARVEGLLEDYNLAKKVTRTEFERMNSVLFSEMLVPIKNLLTNNNLTPANISEIQMLGGGTRVPKVRETVAAFFGRTDVDTNLNGDDAVCMGAAFYAAMKSTSFKKQNFKFRDLTLFPVSFSHPSIGSEPAGEHKILYEFGHKLFSKKVVKFDTAEEFTMRLRYEIDAGPRRLPPGTPRELFRLEVGAANTTGFNVTEGSIPRVMLAFRLTSSGTVELESASAKISVWEQPPPPPTTMKKKVTKAPRPALVIPENATAEEREALERADEEARKKEEEEEATEPAETIAPALPDPIKVNKTVPLNVNIVWQGVRDYTKEELQTIRDHTKKLEEAEMEAREKAKAVNDLEAFLYQTRDRLTDDDLERHATAKERENMAAKLDVVAEFIDGDEIDTAPTAVVKTHLADVRAPWRDLERRIKLWKTLPDALTKCRSLLSKTVDSLENITVTRMVNDTEVMEVLDKINSTKVFMDEKEAEWKKQPENEDPVVTPTDIQLRCDIAKGSARRLLFAPKRPKTTAEPEETTTTADEEATEDPAEQVKQDL